MRDGYAEMHPVGIQVRADMLESVAGLADDLELEREWYFALSAYDWNDPATLRWITALAARRIDELEG